MQLQFKYKLGVTKYCVCVFSFIYCYVQYVDNFFLYNFAFWIFNNNTILTIVSMNI